MSARRFTVIVPRPRQSRAVPTRISLPVGKAVFVGSYFAWPQKRRIILSNASHVLGLPASDRRVRHLARRIYATYAQFVIELMRLPSLPDDEPLRLVRGGGERGEESFRGSSSGSVPRVVA